VESAGPEGLNLEDLMRRRSGGDDAVEPPPPPPFDWGRDIPDAAPTAKTKCATVPFSISIATGFVWIGPTHTE